MKKQFYTQVGQCSYCGAPFLVRAQADDFALIPISSEIVRTCDEHCDRVRAALSTKILSRILAGIEHSTGTD